MNWPLGILVLIGASQLALATEFTGTVRLNADGRYVFTSSTGEPPESLLTDDLYGRELEALEFLMHTRRAVTVTGERTVDGIRVDGVKDVVSERVLVVYRDPTFLTDTIQELTGGLVTGLRGLVGSSPTELEVDVVVPTEGFRFLARQLLLWSIPAHVVVETRMTDRAGDPIGATLLVDAVVSVIEIAHGTATVEVGGTRGEVPLSALGLGTVDGSAGGLVGGLGGFHRGGGVSPGAGSGQPSGPPSDAPEVTVSAQLSGRLSPAADGLFMLHEGEDDDGRRHVLDVSRLGSMRTGILRYLALTFREASLEGEDVGGGVFRVDGILEPKDMRVTGLLVWPGVLRRPDGDSVILAGPMADFLRSRARGNVVRLRVFPMERTRYYVAQVSVRVRVESAPFTALDGSPAGSLAAGTEAVLTSVGGGRATVFTLDGVEGHLSLDDLQLAPAGSRQSAR